MTSKPVALLLADLGVTKTHSRPSVSNDNPYSEAQFKTLKYRPDYPDRFGSLEHARMHNADFFPWYNTEHRHGSPGLHTPHDVHHGLAEARRAQRAVVPHRRVRRASRSLRAPPTHPHPRHAADGGLDQSTQAPRRLRGRASVNSIRPVSQTR